MSLDVIQNLLNKSPDLNLDGLVEQVKTIFLSVVGVFAGLFALALIVAGIFYMGYFGLSVKPEHKNTAKHAMIGLVIAFIVSAILLIMQEPIVNWFTTLAGANTNGGG